MRPGWRGLGWARVRRAASVPIVALAMLCAAAGIAPAQDGQTVRVATRELPPMVIETNGELTGFSIDLWNEIASRLKLRTSYQVNPDVRALLAQVTDGSADLGISAISITSERHKVVDFSQPMLNAGLHILVRGQGEAESNPLTDLLRLLFSPAILVWLGIGLLFIIVPAHLVFLLERRHPNGMIPTTNYFPGIFYAMYWAASTLATQADSMPRHWIARILAVLWMFTGVVFVAFYTAQLTATLTVQRIQGSINGPDDLPGKRVATTRGSTAAAWLREQRADVLEVARFEDASSALAERRVDAVVFDAPVLLYYASHEGKGQTQVVGPAFRKEDYGIAFPAGSPLRKQVDVALLGLREDGGFQRLYDKWFAASAEKK